MPSYNISGVGSFNIDSNVLSSFDNETLDRKLRVVAQRPELHSQFGFIPEVVDDSFGSAFKYGVAQAAQNLGTTIDVFDEDDGGYVDRFSDYLKSFETPENYDPAFESLKDPDDEDFKLFGVGIGSLPRAIIEQTPQLLGSLASRGVGVGAGAMLGGALGNLPGAITGAAIGGIGLPLAFEAAQILGPLAYERARNNGRSEPNQDDLMGAGAAAVASGAINAFALKGLLSMGGGPALRFLKGASQEGLTETAQGLIEQVGGTAKTLEGLDINLRDAALEGLVGAGIGGPLSVVTGDSTRPAPDFGEDTSESADSEGNVDPDNTSPLIDKSAGLDPDTETALDGETVGGNILNNTADLLPQTAYEVEERNEIFYTSQPNDTLGKIAKKFGITSNELSEANNAVLPDVQKIPEGTRLRIPKDTVTDTDAENVTTGYRVIGLADPDIEGSENLPVSSFFGTQEEAQKASDLINSAINDVQASQNDNIVETEAKIALRKANLKTTDENIESVKIMSSPVGQFSMTEIETILPNLSTKIKNKVKRDDVYLEEVVSAVPRKQKAQVADALIQAKNPALVPQSISPDRIKKAFKDKKVQVDREDDSGNFVPDETFKNFLKRSTGADNIDTMSNVQRTSLLNAVENLPSFETETKLPLANRPLYTGKQLSEIVRAVRSSPQKKLNDKVIAKALGREKIGSKLLGNIRANLFNRNIIDGQNNLKRIDQYISPYQKGLISPFQKRISKTDKLPNPKFTPEFEKILPEYYRNLKQILKRRGLGSAVNVEILPDGEIDFAGKKEGQKVEGIAYEEGEKHIIKLALNLDPNQDTRQQQEDLASVLDHETFHVFSRFAEKGAGPLTRKDFKVLDRVIANAVKPDRANGDTYGGRTYFKVAEDQYGKEGVSLKVIKEEAYAELFRDWASGVTTYSTKDGKKIGQPRTIFQRIWDYLFGVQSALNETDIKNSAQVFERLDKAGIDKDGNPTIDLSNLTEDRQGGELEKISGIVTNIEGNEVVRASLSDTAIKQEYDRKADEFANVIRDVEIEGVGAKPINLLTRTMMGGRDVDDQSQYPIADGEGKVINVSKNSVPQLAQKLQEQDIIAETPANLPIYSRLMASEGLKALGDNNTAIGWYDAVLKSAIQVLEKIDSSITESPKNKTAFLYALAVTSNQTKVTPNLQNAFTAYRAFQKTGKFLDKKKKLFGWGDSSKAMKKSFEFYNDIADGKYSGLVLENPKDNEVTLQQFLDTDFYLGKKIPTVYRLEVDGEFRDKTYPSQEAADNAKRELKKEGLDVNRVRVSELQPNLTSLSEFVDDLKLGIEVPVQEGSGEIVKGSYLLGAKIGQGFYQNLQGNYDPLTMDLWWVRMFHRLRGDPYVDSKGDDYLQKKLNELQEELNSVYNGKSNNDKVITSIINNLGLKDKVQEPSNPLIKEDVGKLFTNWNSYFKLEQTRTKINNALDNENLRPLTNYTNYAEYKESIDNALKNLNAKQKEKFNKESSDNPDKPKFFKTVTTTRDNLVPKAVSQPRNKTQRSYMRKAAQGAVDILSNDYGVDIDMADFQALLWYPEKRLYERFGANDGVGNDIDYLEASIQLANKENLNETERKDIARIYDESKKSRTLPDTTGGRGDSRIPTADREVEASFLQADEVGLTPEQVVLVREKARQGSLGKDGLAATKIFDVGFEVAPNPDDTKTKKVWEELNLASKIRVSNSVIEAITPLVLGTFNARGRNINVVGSYLNDTNPSFALRISSMDEKFSPVDIANSLGYSLRQQSMMVVSPEMSDGLFQTSASFVDVKNISFAKVKDIYKKLRESPSLQDDKGESYIGGQSTLDGQMVILNQSPFDAEEFRTRVEGALTEDNYVVKSAEVYAGFPEAKDYNFDRQQKNDPRGTPKDIRVSNRLIRSTADAIFQKTVAEETQGYKQHGETVDLVNVRASVRDVSTPVAVLPSDASAVQAKIKKAKELYQQAVDKNDVDRQEGLIDLIGLLYLGEYRNAKNFQDVLNNVNATNVNIGASINKIIANPDIDPKEVIKISTAPKPSMNIGIDNFYKDMPVSTRGGKYKYPKGTKQIKVNLFKKDAGWKWLKPPEGYKPIKVVDENGKIKDFNDDVVSVTYGDHYYTLNINLPKGAKLTTYANFEDGGTKLTQPSLRPTTVGSIKLGNKVAEISIRGKPHPVYDNITAIAEFGTQEPEFINQEEAFQLAQVETSNQIANLDATPKSRLRNIVGKDLKIKASVRDIAKEYGVDPDLPKYKPTRENLRASVQGVHTVGPKTNEVQKRVIDKVTMTSEPRSFGRSLIEGLQNITSKEGMSNLIREARRLATNKYVALEELDQRVKEISGEMRAGISSMAAALDSDRSKILQSAMWFVGGKPEYTDGGFRVVSEEDGGGKSLTKIFAPIGDKVRDFQTYTAAIRARRLLVENRERLMTDEDIQTALTLGQTYPEFEQVRLEYQEWNKNFINNIGVASGLISQAEADIWLRNSDYIPFTRQGEEKSNGLATTINYPTLTIDGLINAEEITPEKQRQLREIKELDGKRQTFRVFVGDNVVPYVKPFRFKKDAEKEAEKFRALNPESEVTVRVTGVPLNNFVENIVQNIDTITSASMKNVAQQRILGQLELLGTAERKANFIPGYYSVRVQGETRYYDVTDDLVAQALRSLNGETRVMQQGVSRWLSMPTYILRESVTRMPNFIIKSLARDSVAAWQTSGRDIHPVISGYQGFGDALSGSDSARAVRGAMGFGGYDFRGNYEDMAKTVARGLEKEQKGSRYFVTNPIRGMWDWAGHASNAADAAVRVKVYDDVYAETGDWVQAAYEARQVIDYARRGDSGAIGVASALLPFLNARLQGLDLLRVGFGSKDTGMPDSNKVLKAFWARGMMITSLTALMWMLQHDDEDWKNQPAQIRDMNFILAPSAFGLPEDAKPFKFPVSFELGTMFKIFPERVLEYVWGQDSNEDMKQAFKRNLQSTLGLNPYPQIIRPIVEITNNYNMFTGQPLESPYIKGRLPEDRFRTSTSEFAKILGSRFGLSPIQIDHFIAGYTGPLGSHANLAMSAILRKFTGSPEPPLRELERSVTNPFAKESLLTSEPNNTVYQYYELKKAVDQVYNSYSSMTNQLYRRKDLTQQQLKLLSFREYVNSINTQLKELTEQERYIVSSNVSPERKRDLVRSLTIMRNELTRSVPQVRKDIYG